MLLAGDLPGGRATSLAQTGQVENSSNGVICLTSDLHAAS
jgi:hypothetical protein